MPLAQRSINHQKAANSQISAISHTDGGLGEIISISRKTALHQSAEDGINRNRILKLHKGYNFSLRFMTGIKPVS